ncbi:sugar-binding transcriptional regulator [Aliifodinibius sp. S!AR15-10]|uniref:sugar-binding transcriptional regulator n=1 Tax=Aliifodinibius sp. S!AR15-10 TaxID=2950437 RepID=UPI00285CEDEC|nr:sugar-binding transcriptional regulator [Aliifodinibius sp. S!AR15-10]MDR8389808.1 sugar-binding transcriptional regulator [Aliifodinibius sp. S!AR15-10]
MLSKSKLRLVTKVAQLYYEKGHLQKQIAEELHLSQATISRLLKTADEQNIVKTSVSIPVGVYSDMEEEIEELYGLKEVVIADAPSKANNEEILRSIGSAASYYLETTLSKGETLGISSWSTTLLAMVNAMQPIRNVKDTKVVQILGGIGNPAAETHASHLIKRLSSLVNGEAIFLPAPGVTPKGSSPEIYMQDEYVKKAVEKFNAISLALVGIGTLEPSKLLANSGNVFSEQELNELEKNGAIGDICLHFFDEDGNPIETSLNKRVISMSLDQIKKVERTVGIAGGERKVKAIKAALKGQYINVLITDRHTAENILK